MTSYTKLGNQQYQQDVVAILVTDV